MNNGTRDKQLDYGGDFDHHLDPEVFLKIFSSFAFISHSLALEKFAALLECFSSS